MLDIHLKQKLFVRMTIQKRVVSPGKSLPGGRVRGDGTHPVREQDTEGMPERVESL